MAIDREVLARELRAARENRGISQQAAAKRAGLSRTVIAQIELGNRPVSADELAKLASVYRRPVIDLLGQPVEEDDVLVILLDLAPELVEPNFKTRVRRFLDLCREATSLESALGWSPRSGPPQYKTLLRLGLALTRLRRESRSLSTSASESASARRCRCRAFRAWSRGKAFELLPLNSRRTCRGLPFTIVPSGLRSS